MVQTGSQKYGCKKMPRGLSIPSFVGQIDGSLEGVAAVHPPRDMEWLKCSDPFTLSMVYSGRLTTAVWETADFLKIF